MTISEKKIEEFQEDWAKGIIDIGKLFLDKGDFNQKAIEFIDEHYAYNFTKVLFKPTRATIEQFRETKEQALSYFVASNNACPEDLGFALNPWNTIRFENSGVLLSDGNAIAMGNYFLTDLENNEVKVEYTMGFISDPQGNLRLNLHHSSFPFSK